MRAAASGAASSSLGDTLHDGWGRGSCYPQKRVLQPTRMSPPLTPTLTLTPPLAPTLPPTPALAHVTSRHMT